MYLGGNETPEETYQRTWELDSLIEFLENKTGPPVTDRKLAAKSVTPPPIPLSSKLTSVQVKAVQFRPAPTAPLTSGRLVCRDLSGPDQVASQYPRQSLPRSGDMTAYLAEVLCILFRSATDKSRAIFTRLYYNSPMIQYLSSETSGMLTPRTLLHPDL